MPAKNLHGLSILRFGENEGEEEAESAGEGALESERACANRITEGLNIFALRKGHFGRVDLFHRSRRYSIHLNKCKGERKNACSSS